MTTTLVLAEAGSGPTHLVTVGRLLVLGFTGRDTRAVGEHVRELASLGVPAPDRTPSLYRLDTDLVRQTAVLVVDGANTSGEVEPVLVVDGGRVLLTVGSDHTDRDREREGIAAAKAATKRVVGRTCVPVDDIADWDGITMGSTIGGGVAYQDGSAASILPLADLLAHLRDDEDVVLEDGDVVFLGTVPVTGGIRPSDRFDAWLRIPGVSENLTLSYRVVDVSGTGNAPLAKPELEFFDVETITWTAPEPAVDGLTERILARDPASGTVTRMLRFEPGTDTSSIGVLWHDFWEEVYILSGDLHDLTLGRTFRQGEYASRPPGMPHGPWTSATGCVTFEVRYPAI